MKLHFDDEQGKRAAFPLNGARITIGRSSGCDVVLAHERVSRVHAHLVHVCGQYLLHDGASANGTFLNGMRLRPGTGAALREGDVVEIGNTRFVYGSSCERATTSISAQISETSHSLPDLLRDGVVRGADGDEERAEFLRAFVGVPRIGGLERCVEIVARRVGADTVAVFIQGSNDRLQAAASWPRADAARDLVAIAYGAWTKRAGLLVHGFADCAADAEDIRETVVRPLYSAGAAPFLDGDAPLGVLAVERVREKRLDRVELAHLAVMGEAIAQLLTIGDQNPEDTRFGFSHHEQPSSAASSVPQ